MTIGVDMLMILWVEEGGSLNIPQHKGWTAAIENNPAPEINCTIVRSLGLEQGFLDGKPSGSGTPKELTGLRHSHTDNT